MSVDNIEHGRNHQNRDDQNRRDFNREDFNRENQNRPVEKLAYKDLDPQSQDPKEKKENPPDMDEEEDTVRHTVLSSTWLDEEYDDALRISELMASIK